MAETSFCSSAELCDRLELFRIKIELRRFSLEAILLRNCRISSTFHLVEFLRFSNVKNFERAQNGGVGKFKFE